MSDHDHFTLKFRRKEAARARDAKERAAAAVRKSSIVQAYERQLAACKAADVAYAVASGAVTVAQQVQEQEYLKLQKLKPKWENITGNQCKCCSCGQRIYPNQRRAETQRGEGDDTITVLWCEFCAEVHLGLT